MTEFIHSAYNVLLIQEHKLDKRKATDAERFCSARGIAAAFSVRQDEAAREGTAVLVKLRELALKQDDVTFDTCSDGRCTVASFKCRHKKEKVASIYLPTRPNERGEAISQVKRSNLLKGTTILGADHNCVPDLMLDAHSGYENAHARQWEAYLASLGLCDIARKQEGRVKGPYTRMPSSGCYTRIDRLLVRLESGVQHIAGVDEFSAQRTGPRPQSDLCTEKVPHKRGKRK